MLIPKHGRVSVLFMLVSLNSVQLLLSLFSFHIMIIKRISRAPICCTKWEHRALYNNTNNTQTHMLTLMPVSVALTTFTSGEMARCVPVLNACWPDFAFARYIWWGFSSVLTDKPGAVLTPVQVPCVAWDFSPSQLSVQTLTVSVQSPRAFICINIWVNMKKPHTIVWTHKNTAHMERNG